MRGRVLEHILLPIPNPEHVWELFHENSKIGRFTFLPADRDLAMRSKCLHECLQFEGYPIVRLPQARPLTTALGKVLVNRRSVRNLTSCAVNLKTIATLLRYGYGVRRDGNASPVRSFRTVPSAGGLYPLEMFFFTTGARDLKRGFYHCHPIAHHVRLLDASFEIQKLLKAVVQSEVVSRAALIIFITAVFERSVFKYGDRGYRFTLLEAGHVAQNVNLVSHALGLGCVNIGGFFDREIDDLLGLDGITHSTLYILAIGKNQKKP